MRHAVSLTVIAALALAAALSGSADARSRPVQQTPENVQKVAERARELGVGATVRIDLTNGRRIEGVLLGVRDHEIDVRVAPAGQGAATAMTLAYVDIERIRQRKGTSPIVWVALGVGLAILVPFALCAAAV